MLCLLDRYALKNGKIDKINYIFSTDVVLLYMWRARVQKVDYNMYLMVYS